IAFQAAEAALLSGERWLENDSNRSAAAAKSSDIVQPAQWDGASPAPDGNLGVSAWSTGPASNPVFHVGPPREVRGAGVELGAGSLMRTLYPVTAYSTGASATTVVILQSAYEAPPP
ncbi:MAG: pilus assembly protein, partial [Chromatiaceae bacterium]|nr:pilus assembly protein [Chromatiaceae bacterium]